MLGTPAKSRRRGAQAKKNLYVEDDSSVEDGEEAYIPLEGEGAQPEAELALEMSPSSNKRLKSFIQDEVEADLAVDVNGQEGNAVEEEEEDVFSEVAEPEEEEDDEEDDDEAFDDGSDDDFEEAKKKPTKGRKQKTPAAKPKASSSKAPSAPKAPAKGARKKAAPPITPVSTAAAPKLAAKTNPNPVSKRTFTPPSGVKIAGGDGSVRRVGLSRSQAPRGPLSPVKIKKP